MGPALEDVGEPSPFTSPAVAIRGPKSVVVLDTLEVKLWMPAAPLALWLRRSGRFLALQLTRPAPGHADDWSGIARRRPALALAMTLFLLSLAGVPPTGGYFAGHRAVRAGPIALLMTDDTIKKILSAMGLPTEAPKLLPARPPPSESAGDGGDWLNQPDVDAASSCLEPARHRWPPVIAAEG